MAKDLGNQDGIDNSDPNYVNGKLIDFVTKVGAGINQDMVQFFQKLMGKAQITASDDNDNEANGYQFIDALDVRNNALISTTSPKPLNAAIVPFNVAREVGPVSEVFPLPTGVTIKYVRAIGIATFELTGPTEEYYQIDHFGFEGGSVVVGGLTIIFNEDNITVEAGPLRNKLAISMNMYITTNSNA